MGSVTSSGRTSDRLAQYVPFIACLDSEEIAELEQLLQRKHIFRNQVVLYAEETTSFMYVVLAGKVRVVHLAEDGKERILAIHTRGDFFGEMALLDGKTAPATVIAVEDSEVGLLLKRDFERLVLKNEKALFMIIDILCSRLRESWLMLKSIGLEDAEQRLHSVLSHLAGMHGVKDDRGVILAIKYSRRELADYASVSRETVSRLLGRFRKEGVVEILPDRRILLKKTFFQKTH